MTRTLHKISSDLRFFGVEFSVDLEAITMGTESFSTDELWDIEEFTIKDVKEYSGNYLKGIEKEDFKKCLMELIKKFFRVYSNELIEGIKEDAEERTEIKN